MLSVTDKPEFHSSDIFQCVFTVLVQSFHPVVCQESLFLSEPHESLLYSLKYNFCQFEQGLSVYLSFIVSKVAMDFFFMLVK